VVIVSGYTAKEAAAKVKKKVRKVIKELEDKGLEVEKKKTKFIIFRSRRKPK
jgi:biotin operon repressor